MNQTNKSKPKPKGTAIRVDDRTHIYEHRGSVMVYIRPNNTSVHPILSARIPWSLLMESAKRCRPEEFNTSTK